jgi:hypothetical protein
LQLSNRCGLGFESFGCDLALYEESIESALAVDDFRAEQSSRGAHALANCRDLAHLIRGQSQPRCHVEDVRRAADDEPASCSWTWVAESGLELALDAGLQEMELVLKDAGVPSTTPRGQQQQGVVETTVYQSAVLARTTALFDNASVTAT